MKKYITYILALMLALVVSSCSKDEIPMTSTVNLAGEWMVCAYIGEEQITSQFMIITYNGNADDGKTLWVDDLGNFWSPVTKVEVPCDVASLTFGSTTPMVNEIPFDDGTDMLVTVTGGKVVFGAALTPSEMPADAIELNLEYSDDPGTIYTLKGYRRTGFVADDI